MAGRRTRSRRRGDPLAAYRRIRRPMPPPERVIPDRRRGIAKRHAGREIEEER